MNLSLTTLLSYPTISNAFSKRCPLYAFSKHSGSLRKIEESLKFDLRFLYINNQETPSYVTLSKFLNNVVVKYFEVIFTKITSAILNKYQIHTEDLKSIVNLI